MKRRICLYGGAGAGKSATAAYIFFELKKRGYSIEHIHEYVKGWAWQNRKPDSFDQFYINAKQMHYEDRVLRNGCALVVTDSPILLGAVYAEAYSTIAGLANPLLEMVQLYEGKYPAINIFLERVGKYDEKGRWGNEADALKIDAAILEKLELLDMEFLQTDYTHLDQILKYITSRL